MTNKMTMSLGVPTMLAGALFISACSSDPMMKHDSMDGSMMEDQNQSMESPTMDGMEKDMDEPMEKSMDSKM